HQALLLGLELARPELQARALLSELTLELCETMAFALELAHDLFALHGFAGQELPGARDELGTETVASSHEQRAGGAEGAERDPKGGLHAREIEADAGVLQRPFARGLLLQALVVRRYGDRRALRDE